MSSDYTGTVIKLPLFEQAVELSKLPGQDPDAAYAIASRLEPRPEGDAGGGYLVELLGGRDVRVLAWLGDLGRAFACDVPTSEPFSKEPEVSFSLDAGEDARGGVILRASGRDPVVVAYFAQREPDGRVAFDGSVCDLGSYGQGYYDVRIALAVAFLAFHHLPLKRGERLDLRTVASVLDGLMEAASYPDALDTLVFHGQIGADGGEPTAFDRFAAQSVERAGADRVRAIVASHAVELRRLAVTRMFWTVFDAGALEPGERDTLLSVEAALNRLAIIDARSTERYGCSPLVSLLDEATCAELSRQAITDVTGAVEDGVRACELPNPYMGLPGSGAARGGEWDVRTRFAMAAEELVLPFRMEYRFDCDARAGVVAVDFVVSPSRAFPQDDEAERSRAAAAYAVRLSTVLAATAFGSGVGIVRAVVNGRRSSTSGAVLSSLEFERRRFTVQVLPAVRTTGFSRADARADELLDMLGSPRALMATEPDGAFDPAGAVEAIDAGIPVRDVELAADTRPLPADLASLLRAETTSDLDVFGRGDDALRDSVSEAGGLWAGGRAQEAIDTLQDVIDTYRVTETLQGDGRRPLYCANMGSRVVAAALLPQGERFRKVPDSAYDAQAMLGRICREQNAYERAEELDRACVELAPTSPRSYHELALVLMDQHRWQEACDELIEALRVASHMPDVSMLYYRLAFALWQGGDPRAGMACYRLVDPASVFGEPAQRELIELMRSNGIERMPVYDDAVAELRAAGIPASPTDRVRGSLVHALTRLVDEGIFAAAAPLAHQFSAYELGPNGSDVLAVVAESLRHR